MAQLYKNLATSTLSAGLVTGATALAVPVGHGARFPITGGAGGDYFYVFLQDATVWEIVKVVTRATDNFTVIERGAQGSTANPGTFLTGTVVSLRMSAADVEAMVNHMANAAGAHAASAISNTPAPNLVATTVQAALNELQIDVDTRATSASVTADIAAHAAAVDPHPTYTTAAELATGLATKQAANATLTSISSGNISAAWPVGSVFIGVVATNPATLLGGGTWVAFGAGRVMVGFDAAQAEFNTVEGIGGENTHVLTTAEMPSHIHPYSAIVSLNGSGASQGSGAANQATFGSATNSTGGGGAHNNLQPYITCYFWKRTA